MDALSSLLQEARPMYLQRKHERWMFINCGCAVICSLLFIMPIVMTIRNNQYSFESTYAELYTKPNSSLNQAYYIDEFDAMGVI